MATVTETIGRAFVGDQLDNLQETTAQQERQIAVFREAAAEQNQQMTLLVETIQRLEQALYSPDWVRLSAIGRQEFTRQALRQITELARLMALKNPVIGRGVEIQRLYVWGQGVTIQAADPTINGVIQSFLDDERNQAELTAHQARGEKEEQLQIESNLFFCFFTNSTTGRVRVRTIPFDEIEDVITNPEDSKEPWFYLRRWTEHALDGTTNQREAYYPDWRYHPRRRSAPAGWTVQWETPVYHFRVNPFGKFGVTRLYRGLDWALAYKNFLEQLASVWQALARWAYILTTKGGAAAVAASKAKMTTGGESGAETPLPGGTFIQSENVLLQPFRTAGATMSAEDGRRLFLMAAASFGFPETFWGDASVGSLATAKSLDRPTELLIKDRQSLWEDVHQNLFNFVLLQAVKAPQGPLRSFGRVIRVDDGDQYSEVIVWNDQVGEDGETRPFDATVSMTFPAIIEGDVVGTTSAIIDATTLKGGGNGIPVEAAVRRLLVELGFQDVDQIMEVWQQVEEERKAQAEVMLTQMSQPSSDDADGTGGVGTGDSVGAQTLSDEEEEEETAESLRRSVSELVTEIRGAFNGNGGDVRTGDGR
jgi:hypothetical protein